MAKKMVYTDPNTGAEYLESVWLPLGIYTDFSQPNGNVVFLGYATEQKAREKLMDIMGIPGGRNWTPIGSKAYPLTADQVRQVAMTHPQGETILDVLSTMGYAVAETPTEPDPDNPDNPVSFFTDAEDVDLLGMPAAEYVARHKPKENDDEGEDEGAQPARTQRQAGGTRAGGGGRRGKDAKVKR